MGVTRNMHESDEKLTQNLFRENQEKRSSFSRVCIKYDNIIIEGR
jgi:hypothetical protein